MIDRNSVRTYDLSERKNLVSVNDFYSLDYESGFDSRDLSDLASEIVIAKKKNKPVILMFGAHVIKTGVSPFILDLLKKGYFTHLATNGASSIHDFEIAAIGATSEDVAEAIIDGKFGMAKETAEFINSAIDPVKGYGYGLARKISQQKFKYLDQSIFCSSYSHKVRITVHVAIGTDIIHMHPSCDGARLGAASYADFLLFVDAVSGLDGGVVINLGSAVILPEVFLKALSISRNLGYGVFCFTAANMDMIDYYRPRMNVLARHGKGKSFNIIGKHQETVPALYRYIMDNEKNGTV